MKVEVDYKIILFILLFYFFGRIELYLIFVLSIILHELTHMLIAFFIKAKVTSITIGAMGMGIDVAFLGKQNFSNKILFYMFGPLTNFILAYTFKDSIIEISSINFALGIFNLIPILPLDGGKIVLELLKIIVGKDYASEIMICFTKMLLFILSLLYAAILVKVKNLYLIFLILYLWRLYFIEEEKWMLYKKARNCIKNIEIN